MKQVVVHEILPLVLRKGSASVITPRFSWVFQKGSAEI
jgi:hypothetical protein